MGGVPSHIQQASPHTVSLSNDSNNAVGDPVIPQSITHQKELLIKEPNHQITRLELTSVTGEQQSLSDDDDDDDVDAEEAEPFQEFTEKSLVPRHRSAIEKARRSGDDNKKGRDRQGSGGSFSEKIKNLTNSISNSLGRSSSKDDNMLKVSSSDNDSDDHDVFGDDTRELRTLHPSIAGEYANRSPLSNSNPTSNPSPKNTSDGGPPPMSPASKLVLPVLNLGGWGGSPVGSKTTHNSNGSSSPSNNSLESGSRKEHSPNNQNNSNSNSDVYNGSQQQGMSSRFADMTPRARALLLENNPAATVGGDTMDTTASMTPRSRQQRLRSESFGAGSMSPRGSLSGKGVPFHTGYISGDMSDATMTPRSRGLRLEPLGNVSDAGVGPRRGSFRDNDTPSRRSSFKEKLSSLMSSPCNDGNESDASDAPSGFMGRLKRSPSSRTGTQLMRENSTDSQDKSPNQVKKSSFGSFGAASTDECDNGNYNTGSEGIRKKNSYSDLGESHTTGSQRQKSSFNESGDESSGKNRKRSNSIKTAIGVVSAALGIGPKEKSPSAQKDPFVNSPSFQLNCQILIRHPEVRQKFINFIKKKHWLTELHAVQSYNASTTNAQGIGVSPETVQFNRFIAAAPNNSQKISPKKEIVAKSAVSSPVQPSLVRRGSQPIVAVVPAADSPVAFRCRSKSVVETEKQFSRDMMTLRSLKFKETNDPDLYAFHKPAGPTPLFSSLQMHAIAVAILFPLFMETDEYLSLNIRTRDLHRRGSAFSFMEQGGGGAAGESADGVSSYNGIQRRRSSKSMGGSFVSDTEESVACGNRSRSGSFVGGGGGGASANHSRHNSVDLSALHAIKEVPAESSSGRTANIMDSIPRVCADTEAGASANANTGDASLRTAQLPPVAVSNDLDGAQLAPLRIGSLRSIPSASSFSSQSSSVSFRSDTSPKDYPSQCGDAMTLASMSSSQPGSAVGSPVHRARKVTVGGFQQQQQQPQYQQLSPLEAAAAAARKLAGVNRKTRKVTQETKKLREMIQFATGSVQETDLERILTDGSWLTTLFTAVDDLPLSLCVADAQADLMRDKESEVFLGYPTVYVNKRYEQSFQCQRDSVIGHGCMLHQHDDPSGTHMANIADGICMEHVVKVVVNSVREDESEFLNLLTIQPVYCDDDMEIQSFLLSGGYEADKDEASMKEINQIDDTMNVICAILKHC